jgi:hypothetical protein
MPSPATDRDARQPSPRTTLGADPDEAEESLEALVAIVREVGESAYSSSRRWNKAAGSWALVASATRFRQTT